MSELTHATSEMSRQELLDGIYYLRDLAGEREQQIRHLRQTGCTETGKRAVAELERVLCSRSWRMTAPLRRVVQALGRSRPEPHHSLSEASCEALADEIHELRNVVAGRERQIRQLQAGEIGADESALAELDRILRSRSWRLTAPFRWFVRALGGGARTEMFQAIETRVHAPAAPRDLEPGDAEMTTTQSTPEPSSIETRTPGVSNLYVDVTELALWSGKTGIQRVTREILRALLAKPPTDHVVRPVYAVPGRPYRLAEQFTARLRGSGGMNGVDALLDARAGDVFLGLDHSMQAVVDRAPELEAMRLKGVRIWFVCNDTLPLDHPEWFPAEVRPRFEAWLRTVLGVADGVACISRATEAALRRWIEAWDVREDHPPVLGHFALGADLAPCTPGAATIGSEISEVLERLRGRPVFLMVGTVEPRKGHAQTLEAFNELWSRGDNVALVIVGLPGWMTDVVQRRIRHHDEFGKRLFWFMDASDALLERLYATCTALLAMSEGEGFGLPLIEAARHSLPILSRDLPVFREVAGAHATYFSGHGPESLAAAIHDWLIAYRHGGAPATHDMHWQTWKQSARQLCDLVLGGGLGMDTNGNHTGSC